MNSISVVITCYNQAQFVGEAIESVLAQTYPAYEIVVVDDGSQDYTAEVVKQYPEVRYIYQKNQGLVAVTRNKGIKETTGTYLIILDGDDRLLPNHLQRSLTAFQERPDAAFVCGMFRAFGDQEWTTAHRCDSADSYGTVLRFPSIAMVLTAMFRRDILTRSGGFSADRNINGCDDFDLCLRLAQRYTLYCHHELVAEHRLHSAQTTRNRALLLKSSMTVYRSQRNYIRKNPQYVDDFVTSKAFYQHCWGDPLISEMVAATRSGQIGEAIRDLWVLLWFYPAGLVSLIRRRVARMLHKNQVKQSPSS